MNDTPVSPSPAGGTKTAAIDPIFLSVRESAKALSLSTKTVYRLMDAGELESAWFGTRRLVVTASLRTYAAQLIEASKAAASRSTDGGSAA